MAQEAVTLREVQVAAHRRLSDTGIEKTQLDSAQLRENVSLSMADVLTKYSTLFIKSYGRATESTAEFRGTSPSHTQVTWNGMKLNSPMLGTVDFSYIPSYFVDQATLLHGASSIPLTGGGLGGAIELSTQPQWNQGHSLEYIQGVGSFHTWDQFLRYRYSNQHWSSSTRLSYAKSRNNFPYTNRDKMVDERDEQGNITHSYHPTERNKSGYFDDVNVMQDLYYRDDRGNRYGAMVWYGYSLRGLPFLSVDYKDDSDFTNEHLQQTVRSVFSWDHSATRWNLGVKAGYNYQDIAYDYSTTRTGSQMDITHSRSYGQTSYLQANLDYHPTAQWMLSVHGSTYYNHVRSWDRSPYHIGDNYDRGRMEESLSASAKWRPVDPLSLSVVLRQEVYAHDWVPIIPAFFADVVLYRPWNLVFKTSVARNYRYPSMNDLYFQPGGNPDLKPERGFTYDGGLEMGIQRQRWNLTGNLSAFDSRITDWILWTPNNKGYWVPANVKKVHNYGLEATASAQVQLGRQWLLHLTGNYAYTPSINRGEQFNSNDASYGKQLCYVPRASCNLSGRLSWRHWTLGYQWVHYSQRYTTSSNEVGYITGRLRPYYMSDISLEKQFHWRWMEASVKGVVRNLLGTEYVTVLSRPMAGRNFEIFLQLKPIWKKH